MNKKLLVLLVVIAVLVVGLWLYGRSKPTVAPVETGTPVPQQTEGQPIEEQPIVEQPLLP